MSNKKVDIGDAIIEANMYINKGESVSRGAVETVMAALEQAQQNVKDITSGYVDLQDAFEKQKELLRKIDDAYERYWASAEAYIAKFEKAAGVRTIFNYETSVRERLE